MRLGCVTLVGCGPGDPDLLTVKAQKVIGRADVLVTDRLVSKPILALARTGARIVDAGKEPDGPSAKQDDINQLLVREAVLGHRVVRLKSGDGFIFGRAAEEMAAVRAAGIQVDVVPGITAAHACAARVGLPVTLRGRVRQFSVLTGATADGDADLDWPALAKSGQAFAIYMGVRTAPQIERKLLAAGANPEMPVVIVENGTRADERAVATSLGLLSRALKAFKITGPAVIFVGLSWEDANLSMPEKVEVFTSTTRLSHAAAPSGIPDGAHSRTYDH